MPVRENLLDSTADGIITSAVAMSAIEDNSANEPQHTWSDAWTSLRREQVYRRSAASATGRPSAATPVTNS